MNQKLDDLGAGGTIRQRSFTLLIPNADSLPSSAAEVAKLLCQRGLMDRLLHGHLPPGDRGGSCARLGRRRCRANQRSADDGARRGRGVGKHRSLLPSLYVVAPCWQDLQNPTKVQEKLRPRKAHVARPILSPTLGPPYVRGGERRHRPRRETRNAAPSRQRAQPTHRHTHPDTTGWVARACLVSASGTAARATTLASLSCGYMLFTLPVHRAPWLD